MRTDTQLPEFRFPATWPTLLAVGLLTSLVWLVFHPVVRFEFVQLDVPEQLIENPHVHGLTVENLGHVFTSRCAKSYYPLRSLSFALDYEIWGLNPGGFKLTNYLIHLANVLLVFWLIRRLFRHPAAAETPARKWWDASVAAFAAGVFGLHPLVVEPVAWVSGREELLMTLGALGCFHFHLTARNLQLRNAKATGVLACHVGTTLCCVAACLSNAVGAVIPLLITAWDLLTLARPKLLRIVYSTGALWLIAVATIVVKKLGEVGDTAGAPAIFSPAWLTMVLNIFWLNLKTLLWPTRLAVHYAWPSPDGFLDLEVILGGISLVLGCVVLWVLWRRKLTLALFGLCWFGLALGPVGGIIAHHICRADRFLYLPLVGLAVALALGLRRFGNFVKGPLSAGGAAAAGALVLFGAAWLSAAQLQTWRNSVSMWENAVRVDPNNSFAHSCLADDLAAAKQFQRAILHYEKAMRLPPALPDTLADFAWVLATCDDPDLRDDSRALQLAERACTATEWKDRKIVQKYARVHCGIAEHLAEQGEIERAVRHYTISTEADPQFDVPLFNMALIFLTSTDERFRRPDLAVQLAEQGCRLTPPPDAQRLGVLAVAYSQAKRFDEAIATVQQAIERARMASDFQMAEGLQHQLDLYRNRKSFVPELD